MTTALKKNLLGLHNVVIRDYGTGNNQIMIKVLESCKPSLGEKTVTLKGGEAFDAYGAAIVDADGKIAITGKEFSEAILAQLFHNTVTHTAAAATGYVGTIANVTGTSVVSATGILSVAATVAGTAKEGVFDFVYNASNKVDVYANGDIDGIVLENEETGLVQSAVVLPGTGGTVAVSAIALTITCGASATSLTVGDRARVVVRRINTSSADVSIGGELNRGYKEVFLIFGENTERDIGYIQFYKCVVARGALTLNLKDYHGYDLEITPIKDPTHSGFIGTFHRTDNT